ncbi:MAG: hypothetical protein KGY76_04500 [Candidatus Thermoplasmatota archaeon]|nr:hypothetical protein [Candidatus Thermoplasmatota archaeon]
MRLQNHLCGLVVILFLISTVPTVSSDMREDVSESSSIAPFEEFHEPDDRSLRELPQEDILTFNYTYMMDYDLVPKDLVVLLRGSCTSLNHYTVKLGRPDGEEITLVDLDVNKSTQIEEIRSIRGSGHARKKVYIEMRSILRNQEDNWTDPEEEGMVNPTEVVFGELNEDILVDPDPLKGEYEIIVEMFGKEMNMSFGEKETKLALLSQKSVSEPRNVDGEYKDDKVKLEWDEPKEKGGGEIRQYNVYRATTLHRYEYIGNVSGDKTEYVDELGDQEVRKGDILYYKVVTIDEDNYHYVINSPDKRRLHFSYRQEGIMSVEEVVHISHEKTEKSDTSYKWVMDYSTLSEDNFEERVNMDSVKVNKMEGGDVFFYDLSKSKEEDGKMMYDYEGGFFSKGEIDMVLKDGENVTSDLNIKMNNSWCDFSGEIWAEEMSGLGYEGLNIINQSIHSEGRVKTSLNNTFDFNFYGNKTHFEVSKDLDLEWTMDLQLDYEGKNGWIVSKENISWMEGFMEGLGDADNRSGFKYSGSIDTEGTFRRESNHQDDEKITQNEVSKEISGGYDFYPDLSAQGYWGTFSPLIGAGNLGYYLTLDEALDQSIGCLGGRIVYPDITPIAFSTDCQRDEFSTEKLYRYQYMDPMAIPGMGSFLGTSLKRANLTASRHLRGVIDQQVRGEIEEKEFDSEEEMREFEERRRKEILQTIITGNPWIQQGNGIYKMNSLYGGLVIEPLGYFASEPLSEEEIEKYHEDREEFFEDQMAEEVSKEGYEELIGILGVIVLLLVIITFIMRRGGSPSSEMEKGEEKKTLEKNTSE